MALTSKLSKRIDLPHEPGQWLEVRMPSAAIIDRVNQGTARRRAERLKECGGDVLSPAEQSDNDWLTLLTCCVTAWSYPEPVTPENILELDAPTCALVVRALLPQETPEEQKNA